MWTACWSVFPKAFKLYTYWTSEAECSHLWHQFHKPLFTVCFVHIDAFPFQQKKPILMGWTHHKMGQLGLWNVGGVNSSHCWQQQSVHMLLSVSSDTIFARGPQNDTQKNPDLLSVDLTGLSQPKKPTSWVPTPLFCPQPKKPASRVLIPLICPNKRNPPLECWYHWFVPTKETHILSANTTDLSQPNKPTSWVLIVIPLIWPHPINPPFEYRYHWFIPTQETQLLNADTTDLSQSKKPTSRVLIPLIWPNKRNPPLECQYHWFVPTQETHLLSADTTDLSKHFALLLGLHNDSLTPLIPAQSR